MRTVLGKFHRVIPPLCKYGHVSGLKVVGREWGATVGELLTAYRAVAGTEPYTDKPRDSRTHFAVVGALRGLDLCTIENAVGCPPEACELRKL